MTEIETSQWERDYGTPIDYDEPVDEPRAADGVLDEAEVLPVARGDGAARNGTGGGVGGGAEVSASEAAGALVAERETRARGTGASQDESASQPDDFVDIIE